MDLAKKSTPHVFFFSIVQVDWSRKKKISETLLRSVFKFERLWCDLSRFYYPGTGTIRRWEHRIRILVLVICGWFRMHTDSAHDFQSHRCWTWRTRRAFSSRSHRRDGVIQVSSTHWQSPLGCSKVAAFRCCAPGPYYYHPSHNENDNGISVQRGSLSSSSSLDTFVSTHLCFLTLRYSSILETIYHTRLLPA